eukprot:4679920-Lingulodinium_polyedra.AAC.1
MRLVGQSAALGAYPRAGHGVGARRARWHGLIGPRGPQRVRECLGEKLPVDTLGLLESAATAL